MLRFVVLICFLDEVAKLQIVQLLGHLVSGAVLFHKLLEHRAV